MVNDLTVFKAFLKYVMNTYGDLFPMDRYISKRKFNCIAFNSYLSLVNGFFSVDFRFNKHDKSFPITSETLHKEFVSSLGGEFEFINIEEYSKFTDEEKETIVNNVIVPIYDNILKPEDKVDGDNKVEKGDMVFRKFMMNISPYVDSAIISYLNQTLFTEEFLEFISDRETSEPLTQECYDKLLLIMIAKENELLSE